MPKKRNFLVKISQKVPQNAFFFHNFGQDKVFLVLSLSSKNQFGRPTKKVDKIFK